jgi:hypothetical protein
MGDLLGTMCSCLWLCAHKCVVGVCVPSATHDQFTEQASELLCPSQGGDAVWCS